VLAVVRNRNRHPEIIPAVLRIHDHRKIKDPVFGIQIMVLDFFENIKEPDRKLRVLL
jgi:hypothetical protein